MTISFSKNVIFSIRVLSSKKPIFLHFSM